MTAPETAYPEFGGRSVFYEDQEFELASLYSRFAEHEHGIYQASQIPRFYKKFGFGEHSHFVELLGDDTHPVRHMLHTTNLTLRLLDAQKQDETLPQLTRDEEAAVVIAAAIHDTDECEHQDVHDAVGGVVGDVPALEVLPEHSALKRLIRKTFVYPTHYGDFSPQLTEHVELIIDGDVTEFEGYVFQKTEHLGYYETGLLAAELLESQTEDEPVLQLARLAVRVTSTWQPSLESARRMIPYIDDALVKSQTARRQIMNELEPHVSWAL